MILGHFGKLEILSQLREVVQIWEELIATSAFIIFFFNNSA